MSAPTNTQVVALDPTARFAAYVKTLAEESNDVLTSYGNTGISLELAEKAIGLDFCIRAAFKQLAKETIGDHAAELHDLNQARFHLVSSQLLNYQTPAMVLQNMAEQILKEG